MERQWQGKTDGSPWMQSSLVEGFRFFGLGFYYCITALVVPFYMLFGKGFKHSYRLFRRVLRHGPLASLIYSYMNHFQFGMAMIDHFACYGGKTFELTADNYGEFTALESASGPFILLSSHFGNYEICGCTFVSKIKRINVLVYNGESQTIMRNRKDVFDKNNIRMIPTSQDLSHVFLIADALDNGEIVSMPADRVFGSEKVVICNFMGRKVKFPKGPFSTISAQKVPALAVFAIKKGIKKYKISITRLECPSEGLSREKAIEFLAGQYAAALEKLVLKYPTQWFNFYDYFGYDDKNGKN